MTTFNSVTKTHIMIHHSLTDNGNAKIFREYHMSKGWSDIGYNWVIGNGTDSGDGEIEMGRPESKEGAHCLEGNMNHLAISICLVGNFDTHLPTKAQYFALTKLVKDIMRRYNIPIDNIVLHREYAINKTTGKPYKSCPGTKFLKEDFKRMLTAEPNKSPVASGPFTDISNHWAKDDILFLFDHGILGKPGVDGKFNPDKPITRAEMAALLSRALKKAAPTI